MAKAMDVDETPDEELLDLLCCHPQWPLAKKYKVDMYMEYYLDCRNLQKQYTQLIE